MSAGNRFIVSTSALAEIFGVARKTIASYVEEGMPRVKHGRFDLRLCTPWRIKREASRAERRLESLDLKFQQARRERAAADLKELDVAKRRRELVEVEAVIHWMAKHIHAAKSHFLVLPTKLAPQVIVCQSIPEAQDLLDQEVRRILSELSKQVDGYEDKSTRNVEEPRAGSRKKAKASVPGDPR